MNLTLEFLTAYHPQEKRHPEEIDLRDKEGRSWYEMLSKFHQETLKVIYDSEGMIVSCGFDASSMWPANHSIAEIDPDRIPPNFTLDSKWLYGDGGIYQTVEIKSALVREVRNQLLDKTDILLGFDYTMEDCPLSDAQLKIIIDWRRSLKTFPKKPGFPNLKFPLTPPWILTLAVHHGFNEETFKRISHFCPFE